MKTFLSDNMVISWLLNLHLLRLDLCQTGLVDTWRAQQEDWCSFRKSWVAGTVGGVRARRRSWIGWPKKTAGSRRLDWSPVWTRRT